MSDEKHILHFSLGPVQGFIADARRTRDLWAGSFLLSWLTGQAMARLIAEAERIGRPSESVVVFPNVMDDEMFRALRGDASLTPFVGSLPNRFKADVTGIENAGALCETAVLEAWEAVESKVFSVFVEKVASDQTQAIWERQVSNFWEISWVEGVAEFANGKPLDGAWLDQRKNWRTHYSSEAEGNDLCHQMGRLQELSGFTRVKDPQLQSQFWEDLIQSAGVSSLDLRSGERLCSIALIKRFFPLLAEEIIGWQPGWGSFNVVNWPSVSYIAAVPWLKRAAQVPQESQSSYFQTANSNLSVAVMGEAATKLFELPNQGFFKLDGHLYHLDGLDAWPMEEFSGQDEKAKAGARSAVLEALGGFQKECGGPPSEFYSVLLMDGDRIGERIGESADQVKRGLAKFTESVQRFFDPKAVEKNPSNGVLIYAGGDDVLALLPVQGAIEAACHLRNEYRRAFEEIGADPKAFTMSAAIVFSRYKEPIQAVLRTAHHYLDDIAKDKNGRDSLALAVAKPGGLTFDWVTCWEGSAIPTLQEIVQNKKALPNSLLHNLRTRYAPLLGPSEPLDKKDAHPFDVAELMEGILRAELRKERGGKKASSEEVNGFVEALLAIGLPTNRIDGVPTQAKTYHFNSALLAYFLASQITSREIGVPADGA